MNHVETFKQKVKSVIEAHGGRVDTNIIPGVIEQPRELKLLSKTESLFYYNPVEIGFDGVNLSVTVAGQKLPVDRAKEMLQRLEAAMNIVEEIEQ